MSDTGFCNTLTKEVIYVILRRMSVNEFGSVF